MKCWNWCWTSIYTSWSRKVWHTDTIRSWHIWYKLRIIGEADWSGTTNFLNSDATYTAKQEQTRVVCSSLIALMMRMNRSFFSMFLMFGSPLIVTRKYSFKFCHCSMMRTSTFSRLSHRVLTCLSINFDESSVIDSDWEYSIRLAADLLKNPWRSDANWSRLINADRFESNLL